MKNRLKKTIGTGLLAITITSMSGMIPAPQMNAKGQEFTVGEYKTEIKNKLESKKAEPFKKQFTSEIEANKYMKALRGTGSDHNGVHLKKDSVGNKYYYIDNNDIGGDDIENGYGNYGNYYKNGNEYKIKVGSTIEVDNAYFITIAKVPTRSNYTSQKAYKKALTGLQKAMIVQCIEPSKTAEWIDGVTPDSSGTAYAKLSEAQKVQVNRISAYSIKRFSETGNYDYLTAGQLLIWESVGAILEIVPSSIKAEINDLRNNVAMANQSVSFTNQSIKLSWNKKTHRFEKIVTDKNGVLDTKYKKQLLGNKGNFKIENAGTNSIKISSSTNNKVDKELWTATFNPLPKSNTLLGVKWSDTPLFIKANQDQIAGLTEIEKMNLSAEHDRAQGNANILKVDKLNNKPLQGATFEAQVTTPNGDVKTIILTSGNNGELKDINGKTLKDLDINTVIKIREIKAPAGYIIDDNSTHTIKIIDDNETYKLIFKDTKGKDKEVRYYQNTGSENPNIITRFLSLFR